MTDREEETPAVCATELSMRESWPKMADPKEEERVTLALSWRRNHLYLPATIGQHSLEFKLDTGSRDEVVSQAYVPSHLI